MKKLVQQWFNKYIAQEVPQELEVCEFHCHQIQCTRANWSNCQLWKNYNRYLKASLN